MILPTFITILIPTLLLTFIQILIVTVIFKLMIMVMIMLMMIRMRGTDTRSLESSERCILAVCKGNRGGGKYSKHRLNIVVSKAS